MGNFFSLMANRAQMQMKHKAIPIDPDTPALKKAKNILLRSIY